jgi:NAD-dependent dihydropyrimidine dehydrogenase PreA subunit
MVIHFNIKRCIGCQFCVQVCPRGCYAFNDDENKAELVEPLLCLKCRACELNCEGNAIRIEKPIFQEFFSQLI